ncbi:XkdF-like putative serine protease domain-containing protein [Bacillus velezensis]|nr:MULTISPECIES: XkdF-like putative serine protease domain-containing protein [Bacillus]AWM42747.1 terminase [Bacillus amyloliquefaciens]MCE4941368.1 XkdF-like putative serine protease domain-containing protein [Bacillus velezensis]MDU0078142.1 XkdF-like putative serine protease domain-containing protein [Bacillus sp. IG2]MDU0103852.1 XkdF-like putative serine protease domain-containing protein [Bacillus sp. IS1]MDX7897427.1 XkdF-like putative serine protease domain-containing protein [Bacillu
MPRELVNAKITHVSYVDKAANQKQFFFMKSEKQPDFQKEVKVLAKEADEQKLVYGIVYEPDTVDAHGDFMTAAEIEKAAHGFLKDAREIDKQHDFQGGVGEVVESYVAPADFEMNGETIKKGSWVLVTKASEAVWDEIKKGEITGYSMAGIADIAKQKEKPVSPEDNNEKGLFNLVKNFFNANVAKGAVRDKYDEGRQRREFWAAQDALNSALFKWDYPGEMENDPAKIKEALQDFVDIAQDVLISDDILKAIGPKPAELQKAGRKLSAANVQELKNIQDSIGNLLSQAEVKEEEEEMTSEDVTKSIAEALEPIQKRLTELEKDEDPKKKKDEEKASEEEEAEKEAEKLKKAITDAVQPLADRIDAIEKSRGVSKQEETTQETADVKKSIWAGLL